MKSPNDPWATFKALTKEMTNAWDNLEPHEQDAWIMRLYEAKNAALLEEMAQKMRGANA